MRSVWKCKALIKPLMCNKVTRTRLETFKYLLYVSVPLIFGYGLGRLPSFWENASIALPSAAANPKGPYLPKEVTENRPTLHSEFQQLALEKALDAAIAEARSKKACSSQGQH